MSKFNSMTHSLVLSLLFLAGCAQSPVVRDFPETASLTVEIKTIEDGIQSARAAQVDVLAPKNFENAQAALNDARKPKGTLHDVATARAYLDRANEFAQTAHTQIEAVITARRQALDAGAERMTAVDLRQADQHLRQVTSDIENGNIKRSQRDRLALQSKYLSIELQAFQQTHLGEARNTIALAINEGAKRFAPKTLAIAEKNVSDTEAFIIADRHSTSMITQRANETRASANHVLKISRDSKSTQKVSKEDSALALESEQISNLQAKKQLDSKQAQLNSKDNQLIRKDQELGVATRVNRSLENEAAFQERFEQARGQFSQDEAEIYRQGDSLTIRLKSLQFPTAKSSLRGEDFPILAKVEEVIRQFGPTSVIIEGHTDSMGTKKGNEKLSSDRARAVTDYLVASNVIEKSKITAIGYGYQKPLGPNKTAEGRAKNRRVDVIINPENPTQEAL